MIKGPDAFRTISEVAKELDVPQHVLRFWESRFTQIKPMKRGGGRRYYRPDDITLLKGIHNLLYSEGFTIRGVQKILRERGVQYVMKPAVLQHVPSASEFAHNESDHGRVDNVKASQKVVAGHSPVSNQNTLFGNENVIRSTLQASIAELLELKMIIDRARESI